MGHSVILQKEKLARISLIVISIIGAWIFLQFGLLKLSIPKHLTIFVLLVAFLGIVEFFPLPVWKGYTTISFPLVYSIYIIEDYSYAIVSFAFVSALVNLMKRRPLRIIFFNPAQLAISFFIAHVIGGLLLKHFGLVNHKTVMYGLVDFNTQLILFYLINNLIVDFILFLRPQKYTLKNWGQKTLQELNSFLISYVYLVMLIILGHQNRGKIDGFSFFFFYSPLVFLALLGSIIANLKKEKAKLKALFSISSELNKKVASPAPVWLNFLAKSLEEFIEVEAWILWKKENDKWILKSSAGLVKKNLHLSTETKEAFNQMKRLKVFHNISEEGGPAAHLVDKEIKSLLYAPLFLEDELVGLFLFGRNRTKTFSEEDLTSAATLANQMAALIKTRYLVAEQKKSLILEERNRIARDIHDGIAQSLAGAIMNLDTAHRKFAKMPEESHRLILESNEKLRKSLIEVRESIYALRPYPTERVGLTAAISAKIKTIQKDAHMPIELAIRGAEVPLSPMVEKVVFDIFQESTQNAIKHAGGSKIEILLSYQKENVLLKVRDNGKGFSLFQAMIKARNHPHFGILHMNEAAEKIYASLQVDSKEGEGTEITLTVPKLGIEGRNINDKAYASG